MTIWECMGRRKLQIFLCRHVGATLFLSDQQSSDREIGLLCSQLFAYPNESHLLSPQGRSSNESVLLPKPQRELGVRMENPGRAAGGGGMAGGSWAGTVSKGQAGHRELGLLVSWGESAKAVCADSCGYLPQEQGWALAASSISCLIPESFALMFLKKKKQLLPVGLLVLAGCKVWSRWQIRLWRQTDSSAGFVPRSQRLNKHYVNVLNFHEILSGFSLHVQPGRIC